MASHAFQVVAFTVSSIDPESLVNVGVGRLTRRLQTKWRSEGWRHWREGGVLFFDDSFLHEVQNECNSERVVFQVVLAHPDLPPPPRSARGDGKGGSAYDAPVIVED